MNNKFTFLTLISKKETQILGGEEIPVFKTITLSGLWSLDSLINYAKNVYPNYKIDEFSHKRKNQHQGGGFTEIKNVKL